jgi:hypothetical protein
MEASLVAGEETLLFAVGDNTKGRTLNSFEKWYCTDNYLLAYLELTRKYSKFVSAFSTKAGKSCCCVTMNFGNEDYNLVHQKMITRDS